MNVGQILWIFTFGVQKKASKHPKCQKSTLKNKNFEKTKKVPRDIVETFLKRVHNLKSEKNCAVQVPGRTDGADILHP